MKLAKVRDSCSIFSNNRVSFLSSSRAPFARLGSPVSSTMMDDRDSTDGTLTLESWLSQVRTESSKESVLILNPETISPAGFKKPYVIYTVQLVLARDHPSLNDGEPTTIDVQRRFSEFEALLKILKELCTFYLFRLLC